MKMRETTCAAAALALLLGAACAKPSPVEESFGTAQRQIAADMVANPEAGNDTTPVEGLSPATADDVTTGYHERQTVDYQREIRQDSTLGVIEE